MTVNPATFPSTHRITIVLVHGAWTNGSAWRPVYDRLIERGYSVVVAQQPLTSFEADVAAVARVLAMQSDPVILVGHCYGGYAQVPTALDSFNVPAAHPAWKDKPSWYMVAGADRILSPDLERMYGRRAGSTVVEVPGASHAVHQSHPQEVTRLIEEAAASCHVLPD